MGRVTRVEKARSSPGSCGKCQKKLKKGDSYLWWKFRYGGKRLRCTDDACSPRTSELVSSDKLSRCMAAGESIQDAISAFKKDFILETLTGEVESAAEEVREVAGEYQESSDNMESGFGHETEQSEELRSKSENLEQKATDIEDAAGNLKPFEEWKKDVSDASLKKLWAEEIEDSLQDYFDIDPDN